ncbi:MAG TPA: peptidoglycan bridge formation glycyltransferase FemA/FemB family protein [Candidatus Faecimonas gallistercoris]|nr:peptidoglycan bridge formation glycyltransferase FemA/FemB family protein [Candidatus Faecimonas gallistercoris]
MKIVTISPEQFDRYARNHKYRNYYQSSIYGSTMRKFGFNVHFLGIADDSNTLIGASLIIYREVFMGHKIAYAPRGLLFNYENPNEVKELAEKFKKILGKQGFMLLKIDPYIPATVRDHDGNIINFNNQTNLIMANLKNAGFIHQGRTLFFEGEKPRWEALVLLNKDIRTIFNNFDKRTRHKIRKAANSGIECYKDPSKNINILYEFIKRKTPKPIEFYRELISNYGENADVYYARINTEIYVINSRKAYEKEMENNDQIAEKIQQLDISPQQKNSLLNKKMESDKLLNTYKNSMVKATELLKEYPNGVIVAGGIVIKYDNSAFLYIDGFNSKYSNLNPSYLLKWRMIDDYNKQHLKYLNLNGIVGEFERRNKFSGLNEMKLGFNSTITEYIGEFDIVLNNFTYNLYKSFGKK